VRKRSRNKRKGRIRKSRPPLGGKKFGATDDLWKGKKRVSMFIVGKRGCAEGQQERKCSGACGKARKCKLGFKSGGGG